jgi:hypothetical protein
VLPGDHQSIESLHICPRFRTRPSLARRTSDGTNGFEMDSFVEEVNGSELSVISVASPCELSRDRDHSDVSQGWQHTRNPQEDEMHPDVWPG